MFLHLWIALAVEDEEPIHSKAGVIVKACETDEGVCQACVNADIRYPYWNGERCVSCSVGTSYEEPYFNLEKNWCTDECSKGVPDDKNVCGPCPP